MEPARSALTWWRKRRKRGGQTRTGALTKVGAERKLLEQSRKEAVTSMKLERASAREKECDRGGRGEKEEKGKDEDRKSRVTVE